ncbi:TOTE conflict system archaeo-eukaryotic primase domain-containing protein [Bullifex porci]|uniref:TOTE conflict system archaeo-eukaryotic primase domain-containing protein n=1 Tax=Bullifex porci TaxID=2606638 RepID=UPI0023F2D6C4|nr:DEAD/DEAH box helicase family protein [Bullifex porci]MDD7256350.1 DEAD/DEAH box helicase family protein [Bullifex porci]MDY2742103.1 DEAD/DEAH box helicase family protein [Bullifex porci]
MSIEKSFDDKSEALINPEKIYGNHKKIADICIITFSHAVHDRVLKTYSCKKVANSGTANGKIPIYFIEEKNILFYLSPIGSAVAGTVLDEVRCLTKACKFIVFGSCGILDENKCSGKIIIPTEAYRDEGFSYHFEKAADYIEISKSPVLIKILNDLHIENISGRTWTTDAIYRETVNNKNVRKSEGCICVEMECAGLQALCNFRGLELYQFFFGGDLLGDINWSRGTLGTNTEKSNQINCFELALEIAEKIETNKIMSCDIMEDFCPSNDVLEINSVSKNSTPQEKINLFKSLFVGREDVFALRWFNAKSGKSGYSPVCENKWQSGKCDMKKYSCADCPFKLPARLSDQFIFNHLAGRDSVCRDVIGLYPLMEGDLCQFLALDFDNHGNKISQWKSDILAVKKVCNEYSIPSCIEISRSGNGAHLWIFFSEKVPAKQARNLVTNLLKAAMKKNHSISFESFDRMFPNQDEMPKGGYGNLIALPLQGHSVKQGHSVFVNDDFRPFDDQWKYLSSVQKLQEKDLNRAVKELLAITGDFHVRRNEDDENKQVSSINKVTFNVESKKEVIKDDFTEPVQITLSNQIYIKKKGISEHALGIMRRTAVFLNPEYFKKLRMHLPLYNIPRYIDCSKETDSELILPRGNFAEITEMLKKAEVEYTISYDRETGNKVDVVFKSELYEEQKTALKALLKSDCGVLSAGTGFGKTVTAAALISERKINTIIIVQNHNLLEQWKKSIKEFLGITAGTIAGGKDKSTGIIDIAIVNSLTEKGSDEVRPRSYKYGMVIVDECHHVSAFTTENLVNSFKAKYVYGLTATPVRRDGHQHIIFMQCGPILYSTTTKQINEVQGFAHYFQPRFTSFHTVENKEEKEPGINDYYEKMCQSDARNQLIIEDVIKSVENRRTPLILSDRISHLEYLEEKLKSAAKNVILITGKGTQKQKKEQLEKLKSVSDDESLIVLATGKYAGEGFDLPRLDTLMLALPFSWKGMLQQYCGRLHRNFEGKEEVQIFDYVDIRIPTFDRMYQNRLKGYKQLGYKLKPMSENSGEDEESKIFSNEDEELKKNFTEDIVHAKKKIIVSAPYLSKKEVQDFIWIASKVMLNGVQIIVFVKKADTDEKQKKQAGYILNMENAGIEVRLKEGLSQNLCVIDEKILWYGSVNYLGFSEKEACCMRISNVKIASEIESEIIK